MENALKQGMRTMKTVLGGHELPNGFLERERENAVRMKEVGTEISWTRNDDDPIDPKRNSSATEGAEDCAALEGKRVKIVKPIQREISFEKPSLNLKCSEPSPKRPFTLTAVCLDEIAKGRFEVRSKKKNKEIVSRKKSNSTHSGFLQNKLKQATLDHIKREDYENDKLKNFRKSELCSKNAVNAESERNRFEEIRKRRRRINRLMLCAEKSLTSLDKNCVAKLISSDTKKTSNAISVADVDAEMKHNKLIVEEHQVMVTERTNGNQVEVSLVEVRKPFSPMSSCHATNVVGDGRAIAKSPSEAAVNAELTDGEVITVRQEQGEYALSNVCLTKEIRREKPKKECDLRKQIESVSETLMNTNLSLKDMEKMFFEKDSAIAQLRFYVDKLQGLSGKLKEKDDLIMVLESQNSELKGENARIIKELDRCSIEQQNLNIDKERLKILISQLKEEKDILKSKISEMSGKIIEKERELSEVLEIIVEERQKYASAKRKQDAAFSAKIENLSDQLIEKEAIISELKTLRDSVQLINKEVCCMLATVFKEFGRKKTETEIESLLSNGRTLALKDSLISMIEKSAAKGAEANHEECMEVISSLEDRMAVLEAELEESKNYTETLVGVISTGRTCEEEDCGGKGRGLVRKAGHGTRRSQNVLTEEAAVRNISCGFARGDLPQNFYELFMLLECKRQALMQMERKVQDLEELHSNCNYKRVRNEMRIENLEMELAAIKLPQAKKFILRSS